MPTAVIQNESPYRKLFGKDPNYLKLRLFGCASYPWLRPYKNNKLDASSAACVFVGYSLSQSAYLCLEKSTGRVYVSHHVVFDESTFPFKTTVSQSHAHDDQPEPSPAYYPSTIVPTHTLVSAPPPGPLPEALHLPTPASPLPQTEPRQQPPNLAPLTTSTSSAPTLPPAATATPPDTLPTHPTPNTSLTPSQPTINPPPNNHPMRTRGKNKITKPNQKYSYTTSKTKPTIPKTVAEALRDPNWRNSIVEEINTQICNGTHELVPPEAYQNVVGCKWIFTLKYNPDGSLARYKARLVARGFHQQLGRDFTDTLSPVIKSTTVRSVIQLAVNHDWNIRQIDVNNAFLQGRLTDEVYVKQLPGFVDRDRPTYVCRLKKALYGLRQAPRAWYQELRTYLITLGFVNSVADTLLFIKSTGNTLLYVLVYVDDVLITGSNKSLIDGLISTLQTRFSIKDLGESKYFLGVKFSRSSKGLHLRQEKYTKDLLQKTKMLSSKPVSTPMSLTPKITLNSGTHLADAREYRTTIGSLQYLAFT